MLKTDVAPCSRVSGRCEPQINNPTATSQVLCTPGHGAVLAQALALTEPFLNSPLLCTAVREVSVNLRRGTRSPFSVHPAPSLVPATKEG